MQAINTSEYYNIYNRLGFFFPDEILTTYALSLYSKPFTILSGISGTGKTKIAQLFNPLEIKQKYMSSINESNELIFKIPKGLERFNFTQVNLNDLFNPEDKKLFEEKAKQAREVKNDGNFTDFYLFDIEDDYGTFQIAIYGQRASSPLVRARIYKSRNDKLNPNFDSRNYLENHYEIGDTLKLKKIGEKKLKVISVNDIEAKKLVKKHEISNLDRQCFISVKSDWIDNSELLGYYNLVENKYHIPKFLNFLLNAHNNPDYPFFIILDEMNLSKVEHYFSDILSCLESRILKDGNIHQEKIILYSGKDYIKTDSDEFEEIPSEIEIPLNLYITGTVNIDESTHIFSKKVLDRANVIEFNNVDLKSYGSKNNIQINSKFKLNKMPDFTKYCFSTKESYINLSSLLKNHLININEILKKQNLHFGYRCANDIGKYVENSLNFIDNNQEIELIALDHQLIQKVFPKLSGTYSTLEPLINELLIYLSEENEILKIKPKDTKFPLTISKLLRIYEDLSINGYASFVV